MINVHVEETRCQSTGYCARIAPGVFRVDGDGPVRVIDEHPAEDAFESVREAEDACPAAAIKVERT